MSAITALLERLQGIKRAGTGRWLARCPAHGDRSPSLSVRELEGGRVLLHCFAGCETAAVLRALGLSLSDLFERPAAAERIYPRARLAAADALIAIDHEVLVAVVILDEAIACRRIEPDQLARLTRAAARIGAARDLAAPHRLANARL